MPVLPAVPPRAPRRLWTTGRTALADGGALDGGGPSAEEAAEAADAGAAAPSRPAAAAGAAASDAADTIFQRAAFLGLQRAARPPRVELRPDDVEVVNLHEDDSLDEATKADGGAMQAFIKAVRLRLQRELDAKTPAFEKRWLLEELKARRWWLRAERAEWVLLKITHEEARAAGLLLVDFELLILQLPNRPPPVALSDRRSVMDGDLFLRKWIVVMV